MTDIDNVTAAELVEAITDAMEHDDDPAVCALVIRLTQVDRERAREFVRSLTFWSWQLRYFRQRWLA
jgi:hypothetical protein